MHSGAQRVGYQTGIGRINSLWPSVVIWRHRFGSTLAQVMACCQTISWTNVDWSFVKSIDIQLRAISQELPQPSGNKISLKTIYLKFHPNLPGVKTVSWVPQENEGWNIYHNFYMLLLFLVCQSPDKCSLVMPSYGSSQKHAHLAWRTYMYVWG